MQHAVIPISGSIHNTFGLWLHKVAPVQRSWTVSRSTQRGSLLTTGSTTSCVKHEVRMFLLARPVQLPQSNHNHSDGNSNGNSAEEWSSVKLSLWTRRRCRRWRPCCRGDVSVCRQSAHNWQTNSQLLWKLCLCIRSSGCVYHLSATGRPYSHKTNLHLLPFVEWTQRHGSVVERLSLTDELSLACIWWLTITGKPSAVGSVGQLTRPTQLFILLGSINE